MIMRFIPCLVLPCILLTNVFLDADAGDPPQLSGAYLGQKPPGTGAEIFAPGIISTAYPDNFISFAPGGRELFLGLGGVPHSVIVCIKEKDGAWTQPEVVPFSGRFSAEG